MKRLVWLVPLWLAVFALAHVATLHVVPRTIMDRTIDQIGSGGSTVNVWRHAPPTTPESRRVVKPAPDLVYSACAYDLSDGPVRLRVTPWDGYLSLSLYDAATNNFFVVNDRNMDAKPYEVLLVRRAGEEKSPSADIVLVSPSQRGIALTRRIASTPEAVARAEQVRQNDLCAAAAG